MWKSKSSNENILRENKNPISEVILWARIKDDGLACRASLRGLVKRIKKWLTDVAWLVALGLGLGLSPVGLFLLLLHLSWWKMSPDFSLISANLNPPFVVHVIVLIL